MIQKRPGTSFAELFGIEGFAGEMNMFWEPQNASNIIIWSGVSQEAADAFNDLIGSKAIEMRPTQFLTYLVDGRTLTLPLAKQLRHYKSPHWLPVAFYAWDQRSCSCLRK